MNKLQRLFPLPLLPVMAVPIVLFGPLLVSGKAIFWGTPALQFIPWRAYGWELISKGQLPLWNHLLGLGSPLAANYQTAFFYPPNWIEGLFWKLGGAGWQAWSQTLLVMLHLIWAGAGAAMLLRRLGAGMLGQTIAGMAFGCSGYLVARAGFLSINAAVAWLPWILLGSWLITVYPGNRKTLLGLVFVLAMQLLAGHAQTAWYSCLLAGMWVGFWGWRRAAQSVEPASVEPDNAPSVSRRIGSGSSPRKIPHSLRIIAGVVRAWIQLGLCMLLAAGIAAVQLVPTAEYLMQSQRAAAVDYEYAMTYSFWPWRILGLFAPDMFGNPAHGDFWGYANFWEDAIYIGLLPALLGLSALLRPGRWPNLPGPADAGDRADRPLRIPAERRALVGFLGLVLIAGFSLSLGKNTPLFPWLYRNVPTFSMFQAPARFLIWIEISLALLAGMSADRWRRPEKRALYWTRLATAGGFAVTLGAGLAWYLMSQAKTLPEIALSAIGATALAGLWGLLAGGLSLLAPKAETEVVNLYKTHRQRIWVWGVVCMVGLDLSVAGWGLNPGVELSFYSQPAASSSLVAGQLKDGRIYMPEADERELKFERFFRFDTFTPGEDWQTMRTVLLPNLTMLDSLASANNFDPLLSARYTRWMEYLPQLNSELQADWLNLMAVSVVETVDIRSQGGVRFEPVVYAAPGKASEVSPARIRWVPCAQIVPNGEAAWQRMISGNLDISREAVIESRIVHADTVCQESDSGLVKTITETPSSLIIQVEAGKPGWLVLADQWYPGWVGKIDGQPAAIDRADFLFRAVQLDAGKHRVEFRYRPLSFLVGGGITLFVLTGVVLFGYWLRFRHV